MLKIVLNVLHTVAERKSGEADSEARSWGFGLSSVTNYLFNLGQTLQLYLSVLICEMGVIMTGWAISHDCFENGMRYCIYLRVFLESLEHCANARHYYAKKPSF